MYEKALTGAPLKDDEYTQIYGYEQEKIIQKRAEAQFLQEPCEVVYMDPKSPHYIQEKAQMHERSLQRLVMGPDGEVSIIDIDVHEKSSAGVEASDRELKPHPDRGNVDPCVLQEEWAMLMKHQQGTADQIKALLFQHGITNESGRFAEAHRETSSASSAQIRTGAIAEVDLFIAAKLAQGRDCIKDVAIFLGELAQEYPTTAKGIEMALVAWSYIDPISWGL